VLVDWTALAYGCALDLGSRVPSRLSPRLLHVHAGVTGHAVVIQAVHQAFSERSLARCLAHQLQMHMLKLLLVALLPSPAADNALSRSHCWLGVEGRLTSHDWD